MRIRLLAMALAATTLGGCVSSRVQEGAAYGAIAGAVAGAGVGVLITDEDLLGSPANSSTGDTSVPVGGGIAASIAIGAVVGAIVGAMAGHQHDDRYADIEIQTFEPVTEGDAPQGLEDDSLDEDEEPDEDAEEAAAARNPYVSF